MVVAGSPSDECGLAIEFPGLGNEIITELREDQLVGAERVGLHCIGTGSEESLVDLLNQLGTGADQQVDAVLVSQVIPLDIELDVLDRGPHRSIEKEDSLFKLKSEGTRHGK